MSLEESGTVIWNVDYRFPEADVYTGIVIEPNDLYDDVVNLCTKINNLFLNGEMNRCVDLYSDKKKLSNKSRIKSLLGGTNSRSLNMSYDESEMRDILDKKKIVLDDIYRIIDALSLELLNWNSDFRRISLYRLPERASELFAHFNSETVEIFGSDYHRISYPIKGKDKAEGHYLRSLYMNSQIGYDDNYIYFK